MDNRGGKEGVDEIIRRKDILEYVSFYKLKKDRSFDWSF